MMQRSAVRGRIEHDMHRDTVTFSLPLSSPPIIVSAQISRYPSKKQVFHHNTPNWGLDFYHSSGRIDFLERGETVVFTPGDIGITAPYPNIRVQDEDDRDSIYFGFTVPEAIQDLVILPSLMSVGEKFDPLQQMALDAVRAWTIQPTRAQALLWSILWEIARYHDMNYTTSGSSHPAVREVSEIIELELSEKLSLSHLASRVDLAPSTLSRLFHRQTGSTLVAYIRVRRIERASFLMAHTDMPIKEIASRAGIPDLHAFNKTFKKEKHISPSEYRVGIHQ